MKFPGKKSVVGMLACSMLFLSLCGVDLPYHPKQFIPPKLTIPLVSRESIKSFIGASSYNFKLAFTQKSDLSVYIVDFGVSDTPQVIRLPKDPGKANWKPDSPLLSPDGSLVTYYVLGGATAQAAYLQKTVDGASPVTIASQGTDPHFWKDSTGALYVIYSDKWQIGINTLSSLTGFSTFRQRIDSAEGTLLGSRSVLIAKPFNGGISKKGRYLCTGYMEGAFCDLSDSTLYRVDYSESSGSMQICNPSISPDSAHQDWMLFLNFEGEQRVSGYAPGFPALGAIAIHDYLIIVDKTNMVQWYSKCPTDHFEWQCPEWTNDFNFVAALAKVSSDANDFHYDCYLIRRSDNAMLKLTNGDFKMDNTATPSFWIGR